VKSRTYIDNIEVAYRRLLWGFWDSEPCEYEDTFNGKVHCRITNWEGAHVYWNDFSKYWWPKNYGNIIAAWHKYAWDEPGVTNY